MYKNIIFDLGGVLLNIDYSRTINAFKDLGITDFDEHYSQLQQDGLFDKLETGKITAPEFISGINSISKKPIPPQDIIDAWNAMLLDFPIENIKLLEELKKVHKIFLLSNTNEIHIAAFNKILFEQHGITDFSKYFHKAYYSHEIGLRKPNKAVFEHILDEQKLNSSTTLFIDDSEQHVKGAIEAGMAGMLLKPGKTLSSSLKNL